MSLTNIPEVLKSRFKANAASNVNAKYLISIKSDKTECFLLKINNGNLIVEILDSNLNENDFLTLADCFISANQEDFARILNGQMSATTAALSGILAIDGELSLALQLLPIFFEENAQII